MATAAAEVDNRAPAEERYTDQPSRPRTLFALRSASSCSCHHHGRHGRIDSHNPGNRHTHTYRIDLKKPRHPGRAHPNAVEEQTENSVGMGRAIGRTRRCVWREIHTAREARRAAREREPKTNDSRTASRGAEGRTTKQRGLAGRLAGRPWTGEQWPRQCGPSVQDSRSIRQGRSRALNGPVRKPMIGRPCPKETRLASAEIIGWRVVSGASGVFNRPSPSRMGVIQRESHVSAGRISQGRRMMNGLAGERVEYSS